MGNTRMTRAAAYIIIALIVALGIIGQAAPAHAQTQDTGYSITLAANGLTTIQYGNATSSFTADFIHPTDKPSNASTVELFVANGISYTGSDVPKSRTEDLYYFSGITGLTVGQYQLQARYDLSTTSTWIVSNIVYVTVTKGYSSVMCHVATIGYTYSLGQNMTVDMGPGSVQDGTYTITFTGPTTLNYPNLQATLNSQTQTLQVTVHAPQTPGQYQLKCTYNGSPNLNPSSYQFSVIISEQHQTGAIQLYTNPTTVQSNQLTTWYVVIPAGNGLPTPTGSFDIILGNSSSLSISRPIQLSGAGDAQVQLTTPVYVGNSVKILYFGDPVYASETPSFPLTNPPIPGSSGGTPGPSTTPSPAGRAGHRDARARGAA